MYRHSHRDSPGPGHWVTAWASVPQPTEPANLPPDITGAAPELGYAASGDLVLADTTLRQSLRVSAGGRLLRLRLSNAYGHTPLSITAVSVARPAGGRAGTAAIEPGSATVATFDGRTAVTIPPGALMVSDAFQFVVAARSVVNVTFRIGDGQPPTGITSHPGSRTTSYLAKGEHVTAADLTGAGVVGVDHWYYLSGLEVWAPPSVSAAVVLGDSLTDGRGSTTNGNDRWPDQLLDRLHEAGGGPPVAFVNQAAGGGRVLNHGLGPSALSRFDRDVLAHSGVAWLVIFQGVNDIGTAEATPAAQEQVMADLVSAYNQMVRRAHAHGIAVYGATITPFGGHEYDDPAGRREQTRQAVNQWIRESGRFDAVLDFDEAVRDPGAPTRLRAECDSGDGLHLSPAGYRALADAVPLALFAARPDAFGPD